MSTTFVDEQLDLFAVVTPPAAAPQTTTAAARVRQIAEHWFADRDYMMNAASSLHTAAERVAYDEMRATEVPAGTYGSWSAFQHAAARQRLTGLVEEALAAGPFGDLESATAMHEAAEELRKLAKRAPERARKVLRQKAQYLDSEAKALVATTAAEVSA